ncbi:MAG: hypothetical protein K2O71_05600 [Lachnospiraceae bacterium]|nr:hypothetical protein [Lachnospiraceae bacterium]
MGIIGIGNYYQSGYYLYYPGSRRVSAGERVEPVKPVERIGNIMQGRTLENADAADGTNSTDNRKVSIPLQVGRGFLPRDPQGEELSPEEAINPEARKKVGRKSSPEECQTCKERKYQDGSDENVSFKSAAHISPEAAGAAVRAHEGEHVSNAYKEAAENGGEVVNASVTIHTSICPECGRTYVSGGTTSTTIRYAKEENQNPYEKARKAREEIQMRGKNIDYAA